MIYKYYTSTKKLLKTDLNEAMGAYRSDKDGMDYSKEKEIIRKLKQSLIAIMVREVKDDKLVGFIFYGTPQGIQGGIRQLTRQAEVQGIIKSDKVKEAPID